MSNIMVAAGEISSAVGPALPCRLLLGMLDGCGLVGLGVCFVVGMGSIRESLGREIHLMSEELLEDLARSVES